MNGTCEFSYRKNGDASLHCRFQSDRGDRHDWCAHQYLCARTKRWEVSDGAARCEIRKQDKKK